MRVTTGGKPRKQITDKEHIERLQKLCSLIEKENIKLREQVKNLSEATVKRELLIDFAKWFNNNDIIKPTSFILTDDISLYLNQLND